LARARSTNIALAFSLVVLSWGCAANRVLMPAGLEPPPPAAFPQREISYESSGTVDGLRQATIDFFSDRRMLHRVTLSAPYTYVITVWIPVEGGPSKRREQRTAYLVRLAPTSRPGCVSVALNWLVESRGVREEAWAVTAADLETAPPLREALIQRIAGQRCEAP